MSTEREMLEAAARAAGVEPALIDQDGEIEGYDVNGDPIVLKGWNPRADDGDAFRQNLLMHGILPIIPPRSNRKAPEHPDYRRYRDRNRIERMFGKLKQQRRIATRYDKTAQSFLGFIDITSIRLWIRHLST